MDCIFCKIIKKEIPTDLIFENENIVAFNDIRPKAPIHILVIPKKHIAAIMDLKKEDEALAGEIIFSTKEIAEEKGLKGYKLVFNVGREGGQLVDHIHLHLLGGWKDKPESELKSELDL